jgi:protein arginine N-methyltransferase 5
MEESSSAPSPPIWYIGLLESKGSGPAEESLFNAHQANYDMAAQPITSTQFKRSIEDIIVHYRSTTGNPLPVIPALTPPASYFNPNESISQVLGITSSWIDLCSPDPLIASISQQIFNLEVGYAAFCGVQNIIIPGPYHPDGSIYISNLPKFARAIQEALQIAPFIHFQILLPMSPFQVGTFENGTHLSMYAQKSSKGLTSAEPWTAWEAWNSIRSLCSFHMRLGLALATPRTLPSTAIQARWFSEPLKIIFLSEQVFSPNKYLQPVLTKQHQALLVRYMRLRTAPWILLYDVSHPSELNETEIPPKSPHAQIRGIVTADRAPHLSYLRAFQARQPPKPIIESFGTGYQDYLQMPLQPLTDNLESVTYEVFEKDPVKYELYEQAITQALHDWNNLKKPTSSSYGKVVIAVVGAGRGPLVTRALHAAEIAGVAVQVWAVEKNPNAYFLLRRTNTTKWNEKVNVVKSDMRAWKGPLLEDGKYGSVDILVSELLGSFGDNELSPECLDGIQRVLAPDHGISIPANYTAFLTPLATPKIHADILTKVSPEVPAFDVPYVVMLHSFDFLSYTQPSQTPALQRKSTNESTVEQPRALKTPIILPAWVFDHPLPDSVLMQSATRRGGSAEGGGGGPTGGEGSNAHNVRFTQLKFPCPDRGTCHGFAGYFESLLYKAAPETHHEGEDSGEEDEFVDALAESEEMEMVELSTNPLTMDWKSKDMISWFPIFFPLEVSLFYSLLV